MEYSLGRLSKLSGVSQRTLRYYHEIGLLMPLRIASNGYRVYGEDEVDRLQQILLYRALDMPLDEIGRVLSSAGFDREHALKEHLHALTRKRRQVDVLIENVEKTLSSMKGEVYMSDKEKFEGFKQEMIDKNEQAYGAEVRAKYGDETVDRANKHIKGLTKEQLKRAEALSNETNEALKAAMAQGDPKGEDARRAFECHREWLKLFYPAYSREYHLGLGDMYVQDARFTAYYDEGAGKGSAAFLREIIKAFA